MRRRKFLIGVGVVGVLSIAALLSRPAIVEWRMWSHTIPAEDVRQAVKGIHVSEVAAVTLDAGPVPGGIVVKDRETVQLLLQGLKNARVPEPLYLDRTDSVAVKLKNGKVIGPFCFSLEQRIDAFSLEFVEGLKQAGLKVKG